MPGRPKQDAPGQLARACATEIRRELGDRRISGRHFASLINRSETYVRSRLTDKADFTLNDLEAVCDVFEISAADFLGRVESQTSAGK